MVTEYKSGWAPQATGPQQIRCEGFSRSAYRSLQDTT